MENRIQYTPFRSFARFLKIKKAKKLIFIDDNIGDKIDVHGEETFEVFKEISLLDDDGNKKQGDTIFSVVFYVGKKEVSKVMTRNEKTIPFFIGLPGFCNKKFMVNEDIGAFSGKYEWESVEKAKNYANSYAVNFMKKRSKSIKYWITDKKTGKVVLEKAYE